MGYVRTSALLLLLLVLQPWILRILLHLCRKKPEALIEQGTGGRIIPPCPKHPVAAALGAGHHPRAGCLTTSFRCPNHRLPMTRFLHSRVIGVPADCVSVVEINGYQGTNVHLSLNSTPCKRCGSCFRIPSLTKMLSLLLTIKSLFYRCLPGTVLSSYYAVPCISCGSLCQHFGRFW